MTLTKKPKRRLLIALAVAAGIVLFFLICGSRWRRGWYNTQTGELRFDTKLVVCFPWDQRVTILTTRSETCPTACSKYIAASPGGHHEKAPGKWEMFLNNDPDFLSIKRINFGRRPDIIMSDDMFRLFRELFEAPLGRRNFTRVLKEYMKLDGKVDTEYLCEACIGTEFEEIPTREGRLEFLLKFLRSFDPKQRSSPKSGSLKE